MNPVVAQRSLTGSLAADLPRPDIGGGPPGPATFVPPVSNAQLAMLMFIGAEAMLFAGLMGAHAFLRFGSAVWPPPGQPRLPIGITAANSVVLLLSAVAMRVALRGVRKGRRRMFRRALWFTVALGSLFLVVQGGEWYQLVEHGLSLSNVYGSTFAALIGLHGLHVLAAVIWLLMVLWKAGRWQYSTRRHVGANLCGMYWMFVCGLWLVLFGLVYLA